MRKGQKHTEETKQKMSIAQKGKPKKKGKLRKIRVLSEKHRQKIGLANKGKKRTPEMVRKMIENMPDRSGKNHPMYGKCGINSPNYGKRLSAEHKKKIGTGNKGKVISFEQRKKISENHADVSGELNPNWNGGFVV